MAVSPFLSTAFTSPPSFSNSSRRLRALRLGAAVSSAVLSAHAGGSHAAACSLRCSQQRVGPQVDQQLHERQRRRSKAAIRNGVAPAVPS